MIGIQISGYTYIYTYIYIHTYIYIIIYIIIYNHYKHDNHYHYNPYISALFFPWRSRSEKEDLALVEDRHWDAWAIPEKLVRTPGRCPTQEAMVKYVVNH